MSIAINFMNRAPLLVPLPSEQTTVRQFQLQLASLFPSGTIEGDNFHYALVKNVRGGTSVPVNTFENRHKPIGDFVERGDSLCAFLWILGPNQSVYRRNLLASDYEDDECCPVCLDDYAIGHDRVYVLPCNHKFHVQCIVQLPDNLCPLCRFVIPNFLLNALRCSAQSHKAGKQ